MKLDYTVIDPTKNITLLVTTPVARALQPQVAGWLLRHDGEAEQVAFLEPSAACAARLQMMGGEFCGNATMSLGAWLCRRDGVPIGQTRELLLEVSGAGDPVACAITPLRTCYLGTVTMPLPERIDSLSLPDGSLTLPVVFFPGICHIIADRSAVRRDDAEELLRRASASLRTDAVGLLLWDERACAFEPLVYVKETDTAVWEQGCGSGTAALAAYLTAQREAGQCLSLRQPGGAIAAATQWQDGRLTSLTISGTVLLGWEKHVDLSF